MGGVWGYIMLYKIWIIAIFVSMIAGFGYFVL